MKSKGHQIKIKINGKPIETLCDILPEDGKLKVLFIAKTPAPVSVDAGHYFQGNQGKMFWNMLVEYEILKVPPGQFHDDFLLANGCGITDIVKEPRPFGNEPSREEYVHGLKRILKIIITYQPSIIVFVYKKVLDNILAFAFGHKTKSVYGFNPDLDHYFNGSKVFVFPMPGTPCTREQKLVAMQELKDALSENQKRKKSATAIIESDFIEKIKVKSKSHGKSLNQHKLREIPTIENNLQSKGCWPILIKLVLISLLVRYIIWVME
jgi:mismatch-specific thymine-DNA glycosylase